MKKWQAAERYLMWASRALLYVRRKWCRRKGDPNRSVMDTVSFRHYASCRVTPFLNSALLRKWKKRLWVRLLLRVLHRLSSRKTYNYQLGLYNEPSLGPLRAKMKSLWTQILFVSSLMMLQRAEIQPDSVAVFAHMHWHGMSIILH